jgi:hypothetical protein
MTLMLSLLFSGLSNFLGLSCCRDECTGEGTSGLLFIPLSRFLLAATTGVEVLFCLLGVPGDAGGTAPVRVRGVEERFGVVDIGYLFLFLLPSL